MASKHCLQALLTSIAYKHCSKHGHKHVHGT
jgi:hypothetical protein